MVISVREALGKVREAGRPPSFYLDTNVIRDLMRGRRQTSIELFELLKDKNWPCTTSYFTYMELFDIEQEARFFQSKIDEGMEVNRILSSRSTRDLKQEALQLIEVEVYESSKRNAGLSSGYISMKMGGSGRLTWPASRTFQRLIAFISPPRSSVLATCWLRLTAT